MLEPFFFVFSLISLFFLIVFCWILALIRCCTGPYSKTESAVWVILLFLFPIFASILFFILRDGRKPALANF